MTEQHIMRIPGLSTYTDPINNNSDQFEISNQKKNESSDNVANKNMNGSSLNSNNILTRGEREFFINMFPENTEQIEKHVLFTRNGKLQKAGNVKGEIVDGKA
jgi:hypothetical protein